MAENDVSGKDWIGLDLYDVGGDKIGVVEDVRYGDVTGGLQWLVVNTASSGGGTVFVPIREVRRSGDRLSALHTKQRLVDAPPVENQQELTNDEEGRLCRYYGLQFGGAPSEPQEGCDEIPDQRPGG